MLWCIAGASLTTQGIRVPRGAAAVARERMRGWLRVYLCARP